MNFRQGFVIIDHRNDTLTGRSNRQRLWNRPIQWPLASFSQAFWFTLPGLLPLVWFNQDFHDSWEVVGRVFERRDFLLSDAKPYNKTSKKAPCFCQGMNLRAPIGAELY